jgi:hypothetical protein
LSLEKCTKTRGGERRNRRNNNRLSFWAKDHSGRPRNANLTVSSHEFVDFRTEAGIIGTHSSPLSSF